MSLNLAQLLPSRLKQRSKVILVIKFAMAMRTASCMFQKRIKINWKNGVKFDLQNPKHGPFCQWSWNRNNQILDVEAKNQHLQILSKGIRCIHQQVIESITKLKETYAEAMKLPFDEKQQKFTVPSCPFRVSFCFKTTAGKKVNHFIQCQNISLLQIFKSHTTMMHISIIIQIAMI